MSQNGTEHRISLKIVAASVAIVAILAFALLVNAGDVPGVRTSTPSSQWLGATVSVPVSFSNASAECFFVNSSVHVDRFSLYLIPGPAGYILNGTFDHGLGTSAADVSEGEGQPCLSGCLSSKTWTSPDGTGQVYWTFTTNVTLEALE
jgi:hypothetical protein